MPLITLGFIKLFRDEALKTGQSPQLDKDMFLEILDLASMTIAKRNADAGRAKKHRARKQGKPAPRLPMKRPLDAVVKSAPLPPVMPATAPVAGPLDDLLPDAPIIGLDPGFEDPVPVTFPGDSITVLEPEFDKPF